MGRDVQAVQAAHAVLVVLCLVGAWLDTRYRRLPNWLSLLALVSGLVASVVLTGFGAIGSHLLHSLVILVIGMALFRFGLIGGGDAKFYTGIAAWFSLAQAPRLLLSISLSGLVLLIAWFVWRRLAGKRVRKGAEAGEDKFPYGVAIAAGAILSVL
ncbi:MAG: prepilin peptidase [Sphingomonadales bacterium]|nr:prepilin peptidase [Sphingomonadales bacterium]MDE2568028.1 prepilin peptidase [Sphingomonadales bacterium]